MPYPKDHKAKTRKRIIETARILFNRHGFDRVTIDQVMSEAGLTRGGFYAHFKNKEMLFGEAIQSFLHGRGAQWRSEAGVDPMRGEAEMALRMVNAYLSREHLADLDGQCPMIALNTDVARAGPEVQESYQELLQAMVWLFETNLTRSSTTSRQTALSLAALCVGGMIISRTLPNSLLAEEVQAAAHKAAVAYCVFPEGNSSVANDRPVTA